MTRRCTSVYHINNKLARSRKVELTSVYKCNEINERRSVGEGDRPSITQQQAGALLLAWPGYIDQMPPKPKLCLDRSGPSSCVYTVVRDPNGCTMSRLWHARRYIFERTTTLAPKSNHARTHMMKLRFPCIELCTDTCVHAWVFTYVRS